MHLPKRSKRRLAAMGLQFFCLSAVASNFNSAIADFLFIPAHLALGAVALALLLSATPARLGFGAGIALAALSLVNSMFIWTFARPKSIPLELEVAPADLAIGAAVMVVPVLLSVALLVKYWRARAT